MAEQYDSNAEQRKLTIEEIGDYQNSDILEILEDLPIFKKEYEITPSDYEAIIARAKVLAKEGPLPVETLFVFAYVDRMEYLGFNLDEEFKQLPEHMIHALALLKTGIRLSSEEIELAKNSGLPPKKWIDERAVIKGGMNDVHVAIDENDMVVASGKTAEEALSRGQKQEEEGFEERTGN